MKSSSELSALVESSANQPKLEDFLGGISFTDPSHKIASGYLYDSSVVASNNAVTTVNPTNRSNIGLSTIKNWLRSQPANPTIHHDSENKSIDANSSSENPASSQNLALTISNDVESKQGNQNIANESAPRKTVDTFGQRTSIYRGVTRFVISSFRALCS
jgi:AP2-like factor, ANT lineage